MTFAKAGLVAAVLALTVASAMAQADPAGTWELSVDTPQGANIVMLVLKQDGDRLTGELSNQMGIAPVTGTFSDGTVVLTAAIAIQGTSLLVGINGKFDADALNGTIKFGEFGEAPFVGKRSTALPPVAAAAPSETAATLAPPAADINGKWDVVLTIAGIGEFSLAADIKQDGNKVSGMLTSPAGDVPVTGTLSGPSLRLEVVVMTPAGAVPVVLTGELGDAGFTGKATLTGMGEADWKGTRGK